jgi:hypothetical protein
MCKCQSQRRRIRYLYDCEAHQGKSLKDRDRHSSWTRRVSSLLSSDMKAGFPTGNTASTSAFPQRIKETYKCIR